MSSVILSDEHPIFADELRRRGFDIIPSENIGCFIDYERRHADMQCLIIDDTAFVLSCCGRLADALAQRYKVVRCATEISGKYPANVPLNAVVAGRYVIARVSSLDEKVAAYCVNNGYQLINVRQGYAKCSCAIVGDNAVITSDRGIYNSLREYNIDVLLIQEGRVALSGDTRGFIGGASGLYRNGEQRILFFCGDIKKHPDHEAISRFCDKYDTEICPLSDGGLTDIGGMIFC